MKDHLYEFPWYAPHQAWLKSIGCSHDDDKGTSPKRANLSGSNLSGADIRAAILRWVDLSGTNLSGANLSGANLSGADLSGADFGDLKIPIVQDIDAKVLGAISLPGNSLGMGSWHHCETTHCRAGWAIHLAGEAGYALEKRVGPCAAGALIYAASRPSKPVPDFYATNEVAMRSIREDAGVV